MKEFLQGRRLGFALRPQLGQVIVGLGIAVTLLDLAAWFQWGLRSTNGYVVGAYLVLIVLILVGTLGAIATLAEWRDSGGEDRSLARLDVLAAFTALVLYTASLAFRSAEMNAAGVSPAPLLLALAALLVLLVDGVISASLYAGREWEEVEEELPQRHRRRRAATH